MRGDELYEPLDALIPTDEECEILGDSVARAQARSGADVESLGRNATTAMGLQVEIKPSIKVTTPQTRGVAEAFNNNSEDEVEVMPREAMMRMKNRGKFTVTASGQCVYEKPRECSFSRSRLKDKCFDD